MKIIKPAFANFSQMNSTRVNMFILLIVTISIFMACSCEVYGSISPVKTEIAAPTSVKAFGAKGDGITDDTSAIQSAINKSPKVFFPQGTYLVKLNGLTLRDNSFLLGEGKLSKIKTKDTLDPTKDKVKKQHALFRAANKSDITIESLCFETPNSTQGALLFVSCTNITVTRCYSINCQLISVCSSAVSPQFIDSINAFFDIYDRVLEPKHYSNNIMIEGNQCVGDGIKGRGGYSMSGIFVSYANNVRIANNNITGYIHGITWWGGNANTQGPAPNGFESNDRKCKGISISGNTIYDIEAGGIWGTMSERVTITGNSVINCGDVGIDFEGSINSTATGNAVQNCANACLCTCFDNEGIMFSGNSCSQNTELSYIAYVQNLHHSDKNKSVSFIGNTFTANKGLSMVISQGVQHLLFEGNILRNVYINFNDPNLKHFAQIISGNNLYFDSTSSSFSAIGTGPVDNGGNVIITGNSLYAKEPQHADSSGIHALAASSTAERYQVANNIVSGWGKRDISIQSDSLPTKSGSRHLFSLSGNIIDSFSVNQKTPDSITINAVNNLNPDGILIKQSE